MMNHNSVYRRLQQHLDKFPIGFPAAPSGVDQELLRYLFDETEAEITCALNLIGEPVEKIAPRLRKPGLGTGELAERLEQMAAKGIINSYNKRSGGTYYHVAFLAIGIFEFQVERMTPEFFRIFKRYLDEAFRDELLRTRIPQLRTIPTEGSLLPDLVVENYDHIRKLIADFDSDIAVAKCVCRVAHDSIDEPCQVTDERETCLIFGSAARRFVHLGWGRKIDKDEVFKILEQAETDGLVIQPSNTQKLFAACLCCGCCCEVLTSTRPLENPVQYFATNFQAVVDEENCVGCGKCVERCQMEAVIVNDDKKAVIDYSRCIGCGVCVPTCKPQAIRLERRETTTTPPKDAARLYLNILKKKVGSARQLMMITKQLLGRLV
jgi:Pyruvate/2-oxoacid:ferredoxin oxidoreductase delta subunit